MYDWAIEPVKPKINTHDEAEKRRVYRTGFRFLRAERQSAFCRPSINAQTMGWHILSPVDITFSPISETQFRASEEEAKAIGHLE